MLWYQDAMLCCHVGRCGRNRVAGPGLISSCGALGQVLPETPGTLLAWHRKLAAGMYGTAPYHRNPSRRPAEPPQTHVGRPGQRILSGPRDAGQKCRSITNPLLGRDRIAAISWPREVGPQPGRATNIQRDLKWRGLKDLIVCQRGIGPAAKVAAGLIQAAAPGPAGHPPRALRAANTPGHGR